MEDLSAMSEWEYNTAASSDRSFHNRGAQTANAPSPTRFNCETLAGQRWLIQEKQSD